jgi:hypothetical protein
MLLKYCALSLARFAFNRVFVWLTDVTAKALDPVSDLDHLAISIALRAYH